MSLLSEVFRCQGRASGAIAQSLKNITQIIQNRFWCSGSVALATCGFMPKRGWHEKTKEKARYLCLRRALETRKPGKLLQMPRCGAASIPQAFSKRKARLLCATSNSGKAQGVNTRPARFYKACKCGGERPIDQPYCKACHASYMRQWRRLRLRVRDGVLTLRIV